jgi:hypothetical protein
MEAWRQEYNDERPKRSLVGLTPAQYAKQLAARPLAMPEDSKNQPATESAGTSMLP